MRVDTDDFGRPCRCGKEHHIEVEGNSYRSRRCGEA